ncbi:conserved hypothetical protein [Altererythrobacter sp. B11]|nr:conserved hypothetical protein [Altererythrobacter sp. B11]
MLLCGAPAVAGEAAAYHPPRTAWGDPDLRGTWPIQNINDARIPLERSAEMGERARLTEKEFAERVARAEKSDGEYANDIHNSGTQGLADWLRHSRTGHQTSLLVSPPDGRLPPLTPEAQALFAAGRSSWKEGQAFDWVSDMDAFDRCITRGFPAMMLPKPYNNGLRIFQSPGYVVLQLEMFGTRIVRLGEGARWPDPVRGWYGDSRGRWEGDTLVIETTNIVTGDGASRDVAHRAASPLPNRNFSTLPMGPQARTTERLTMTGPDTIAYEVTFSDPAVFTRSWTAAFEWTRDSSYQIYEYACHERNDHVRTLIETSRAARRSQPAERAAQ